MEILKKVAIIIGTAGITIIALLSVYVFVSEMKKDTEAEAIVREETTFKPVETLVETQKVTPTFSPIPTIEETEIPKDNTYIIADSNLRVLSDAEVNELDANMKQMAINEIYARHGRKFQNQTIQEYFNQKAWYVPSIEAEMFDESVFNEYEKNNIKLLAGTTTEGQNSTDLFSSNRVSYGRTYTQEAFQDPYQVKFYGMNPDYIIFSFYGDGGSVEILRSCYGTVADQNTVECNTEYYGEVFLTWNGENQVEITGFQGEYHNLNGVYSCWE